ncbi:MAG: S58 family peptidase [Gammaproteobacteria bacterium]|nr:S58 family peptidase [Gammaproteobacteria bacterium]
MEKKGIRARDLGFDFCGVTGTTNSLVDVPGVLVGMKTRIEGEGPLITGKGPIRSGVTAILPRGRETVPHQVWAGTYSLNGNGEMTGSHWIRDGGYFVGPICLTNTHSVGMVHHGATQWMIHQYSAQWENEHLWAMPVVAETYDGVLNDINGLHITATDAIDAIADASADQVKEGNVGGGTGMICYGFKGGTGSASRVVSVTDEHYTVGALVQANHGIREWFTPLGVPVGKMMADDLMIAEKEKGSIIVILGTDIPLLSSQLERIARRAAIAIGRGGSPGGNDSGDIFLAFSTANSKPLLSDQNTNLNLQCIQDANLDQVYLGAVEAVEEAVINAMIAAEDMTTLRPAGKTCRAINHTQFINIMQKYGRCR